MGTYCDICGYRRDRTEPESRMAPSGWSGRQRKCQIVSSGGSVWKPSWNAADTDKWRKSGKYYDEYEPWKYTCISVDDDDLTSIIERISCIDFYWHTLSAKGKGLAYYGITLIPPDSLKAFIDAIADIPKLCELKKLLEEALDQNKWMIHYGI